tara:strand:- start:101 stop:742 length:642 start_codon:yes stop_codon:yes gene_type:complete
MIGSVYKIVCKDENINEIYVGSSVNFKDRLYSHKGKCNNENSKSYNYKVYQFIRENGGWDNWDMIKIIDVDCEDEKELKYYEQLYISSLNPKLNCKKSYTTKEERKEYIKEYHKENKERTKEYQKEYRKENKERTKEYNKEYREQNKDKAKENYEKNKEKKLEKAKEYREINKEKRKQKINCDCGGKYTHQGKSRHLKNQKHLSYIEEHLKKI